MKKQSVLLVALFSSLQCAYAAPVKGIDFQHENWQVACDNTRTCRAAGYQDDSDNNPVSVLLTRKAEPRQAVQGELKLGDDDRTQNIQTDFNVSMLINGKRFGNISIAAGDLSGVLSAAQVNALLASVRQDSRIEFVSNNNRWTLSDKGAAAVLLKMDEFQGRLNTTGALIKKGSLSEAKVLAALPKPVIVAAKVPAANPQKLSQQRIPVDIKTLQAGLKATINPEKDDCPMLTEPQEEATEITVIRLNDQKLLASTLCWHGAYNEGYGYWLINAKQPYAPVLVTASVSDYDEGTLYANHKGRGIGDCWSSDVWVWDGRQFIHTESSTTGMCKLVAAGGAWDLPTLVSTVK